MAPALTPEDIQVLYQQHGPALLAYGVGILEDRAAAEDVLHHVFLKLLGGGKSPAESRPYLFKAVRNAALNALRNRRRLAPLDGHAWLVPPAGMAEAAREIERAMLQLPPEQREVIAMRIWAEMTFAAIAAVLEISENTAASRYRYGLAKLRELLRST
jgi:DNA-directed RNA polymerase specialized sigma24 family protein